MELPHRARPFHSVRCYRILFDELSFPIVQMLDSRWFGDCSGRLEQETVINVDSQVRRGKDSVFEIEKAQANVLLHVIIMLDHCHIL